MWSKYNPPTLLVLAYVGTATWKMVWRFLRKVKLELPCDLEIPFLGINPDKTVMSRDTCTLIFIAALFKIAEK